MRRVTDETLLGAFFVQATFVLATFFFFSITDELLSRLMAIVWRRNHPRSHDLPMSVALFEELPWRLLFCAVGSSGLLL